MKKQRKKIICGIIAAVFAAAIFTGCTDKNPDSGETTAQTDGSVTSVPEKLEDIISTRPLEEGDDYAINKISNKTEGGVLPGDYKFINSSEERQIKLYSNNDSGIKIISVNYFEDLPEDMAVWADSVCANIVLANVMVAETKFGDPVKTSVCGFDAIMYDYELIYYNYEKDPNDPDGDEIRTEAAHNKCRNYYFYSEQDAYAIMFETLEKDWDRQLPNFEKFVADLQVTKIEY